MEWFQFIVILVCFFILFFEIIVTCFIQIFVTRPDLYSKLSEKPRRKPPREKTRQEKALEDYQHNLVDFTFNDGKNQREIK